MSNLAERLRVARKSRGWSQADLAERAGLSRSAIGMYETGSREPDFETMEALCDAFNCSMSYLLDDVSLPNDAEVWDFREACRKNPDMRTLFSLARTADPTDMKAAIAVLETLKGARR